jgi:hypothetical protein
MMFEVRVEDCAKLVGWIDLDPLYAYDDGPPYVRFELSEPLGPLPSIFQTIVRETVTLPLAYVARGGYRCVKADGIGLATLRRLPSFREPIVRYR